MHRQNVFLKEPTEIGSLTRLFGIHTPMAAAFKCSFTLPPKLNILPWCYLVKWELHQWITHQDWNILQWMLSNHI